MGGMNLCVVLVEEYNIGMRDELGRKKLTHESNAEGRNENLQLQPLALPSSRHPN